MESYFQEVATQYELNEDARAPLKSWNYKSPPVEDSENNNNNNNNSGGGFDCNICLDSVHDPVVTFCGHIYCWPCIYKWIHCQTISSEKPEHQEPECPVCKAKISEKTLIPLYGRGLSTNSSDRKAPDVGIVIPQRPQTPRCTDSSQIASTRTTSNSHPPQQLHHRSYPQSDQYYHPYPGGYMASPMISLGGAGTNLSQPMVGMFGEMVYARIFGNPPLYSYPNTTYHQTGPTSQRMRRRIMAVDKSLNRICFFLFCCMVLCLLLF